MEIVLGLFSVSVAAVLGGLLAKYLKLPTLVGYIVAGIAFAAVLPASLKSVSALSQIGTILLLFSIGVELSLTRLSRFFKVAVFGSLAQIVLVTAIGFLILNALGFTPVVSGILAFGFSISSTALLVKVLGDSGEEDTIHGEIMFGWSLVQDLAVIPVMVVLPYLAGGGGGALPILLTLGKAIAVILATILLGKLVIPYLIHKVGESNSRELLLLTSVALALGTAAITSFLGISPALGAFLAGVVISDLGEHNAIFAEIRPLRDLFVALFFVTLGFLVDPALIFSKFPLILLIVISVIVLKMVVVFAISSAFGYKGKTAIANSFGLAQVGEFAFVIFTAALGLGLISLADTSFGITITLLTLVAAPIIFSKVVPFWRKLKVSTAGIPFWNKIFSAGERADAATEVFSDHIIICGYGRVGKWVGRALNDFGIPFLVIDYNQNIVSELKNSGIAVLYGDPTEPEVLEAAGVRGAKAVILAIPDRVAQETLIAHVQTVAPGVKIISRVHQDADWDKFKAMKVDKIIQPEFEAALEIIRTILGSRGKTREEISEAVKGLRVSHSR